MKKIILIVLLSLSCLCLKAQINLDSLYTNWSDDTLPDSVQAQSFNGYVWNGFLFNDPDSAFRLAETLYEFADRQNLPSFLSKARNIQGISFAVQGELDRALKYYNMALESAEANNSRKDVLLTLNNVGLAYSAQGNLIGALEIYLRCLDIHEELKYSDSKKAPFLQNIGNIYSGLGDFHKALEYQLKGLKLGIKYENLFSQAIAHNNAGESYIELGLDSIALRHQEQSLEICERIDDKSGVAYALASIGSILLRQGDFVESKKYLDRSYEIQNRIGDKKALSYIMIYEGMISEKSGSPKDAIKWCELGLSTAKESGDIKVQRLACNCLYKAYKFIGNVNKALAYHEQVLILDDSLKTEETTKRLQLMEFQKQNLADSLKQEEEKLKMKMAHQKEVVKKDKTRNMLMGSGLMLLLAAIGFFSRWRYVKKSRDTISKEKDRSENLLLNILPAEIAEELKEKGEAAARDFDRVSILFTDFKGFTQASEKLSANDLVAEINVCFKAFDGIVGKYNIEKIKTIGDAYMCAGGLPVPDENAVKNTVLAGLEMNSFMTSRKIERHTANLPAFEMRVGIHTGPVVAGIVGVKKFQYDIWGDTVNTASRIESNGEVGKVNISQATYDLLKDDTQFSFESRGKIEAKGKGEIEMYFVSKA